MAKGAKKDKPAAKPSGDSTVVGCESEGFCSIRLYLSDGSEVVMLAVDGDFEALKVKRDAVADALAKMLTASAVPAV